MLKRAGLFLLSRWVLLWGAFKSGLRALVQYLMQPPPQPQRPLPPSPHLPSESPPSTTDSPISTSRSEDSRSSPMSIATSSPASKRAYQDSKHAPIGSKGSNSPVLVAKQIVSERGAVLIACVGAAAMGAYSIARVQSLSDLVQEHHMASQRESAALLASLQTEFLNMHTQYEHELDHYKEAFLDLDRKYRMAELKLDDTSVVLHRAGLKLPGDYTRGPQGALDAESFHVPQKGVPK